MTSAVLIAALRRCHAADGSQPFASMLAGAFESAPWSSLTFVGENLSLYGRVYAGWSTPAETAMASAAEELNQARLPGMLIADATITIARDGPALVFKVDVLTVDDNCLCY